MTLSASPSPERPVGSSPRRGEVPGGAVSEAPPVASKTGELSADGRTLLWDGYVDEADKERRRTYGIKLDQVVAVLASQGGVCPHCGKQLADVDGRPLPIARVHHVHLTGEIGAVLCDRSNRSIPEWVERLLLDPPARRATYPDGSPAGPLFVPPARLEAVRHRKVQKAARRSATSRQQPARPSNDYAAKVAAALAAAPTNGGST